MANWKHILDLRDTWKDFDEGHITIEELGKEVAKRIRNLPCYKKYVDELEDIEDNFEFCVGDIENFDNYLKDLYDFADFDHRLWIKTRG